LLIRDGAVITTKLDDVLQGLGPVPQGAAEPSLFPGADGEYGDGPPAVEPSLAGGAASGGLSDVQSLILQGIGSESADVDTIVERTSLPAHVVLQELTFLSLKGRLRRVDGQTYARRNGSA
jgi:predicted Rossmann fold nucleotide-binding protein DprA/Smf involved in DNA uptake